MSTPKSILALALAVALLSVCAGVSAQPAGRGDGPSPELMAKAQTLEAETVAASLSLPAEKSAKLVAAYKAARESHGAALRAKQTPGERPDYQVMREVTQAEAAKFDAAVKEFLGADEAAKAAATLGTFNRRWDRMVLTLDGMNLDEKPKAEAMKLVMNHVEESGKALRAAGGSGDFQAMREQGEKLREKLDAELAKILSAEQLTKWKSETAMRGGRRG